MKNIGVTTIDGSTVQLFAGEQPCAAIPVTIATGSGVLKVGQVLGRLTGSGNYAPYDNTKNDGTETARLILAEEVDATNEDVNTVAFGPCGVFNVAALTGYDEQAEYDLLDRGIVVLALG